MNFYQWINPYAQFTTAAGDKFCDIFADFQKKKKVWYIMPYLLFLKKQQNLKLSSAANYRRPQHFYNSLPALRFYCLLIFLASLHVNWKQYGPWSDCSW